LDVFSWIIGLLYFGIFVDIFNLFNTLFAVILKVSTEFLRLFLDNFDKLLLLSKLIDSFINLSLESLRESLDKSLILLLGIYLVEFRLSL